jgi:hypothetical protein
MTSVPTTGRNFTVQPFPWCPLVTGVPPTLGADLLTNPVVEVSLPPPPIATLPAGQAAVTVPVPAAPAVTTVVELEAALGPVAPVAPFGPVAPTLRAIVCWTEGVSLVQPTVLLMIDDPLMAPAAAAVPTPAPTMATVKAADASIVEFEGLRMCLKT